MAYEFPGHHPARGHSLSLSSIHAFDQRAAFPAAEYGPQYQDYMRVGEQGGMGVNGDNKQRKRRGNLPKETTDKLRAWFMAHLQHPYPTEDEKQDLMRQTGLQMSRSSLFALSYIPRRTQPGLSPVNVGQCRAQVYGVPCPKRGQLRRPRRLDFPLSCNQTNVPTMQIKYQTGLSMPADGSCQP